MSLEYKMQKKKKKLNNIYIYNICEYKEICEYLSYQQLDNNHSLSVLHEQNNAL